MGLKNPYTRVRFPPTPPRLNFPVFDRRIGGRHEVPPIGFAGGNPLRSARAGAPRGWPRRGSSRTLVRQQPFLEKGCYPLRFSQEKKRLLSILASVRANHSAFVQDCSFVPPAISFRSTTLLFLGDIFLGLCLAPSSHREVAGAWR